MSQLLPFPDLTQRMLAAYIDLAAFARGGEAAEEIIATGEILPRIWDLTTIADADLRWDCWVWLEGFVVWLNSQHAWYSADHTPGVGRSIHHWSESSALWPRCGSRLARPTVPLPLEEWHRYALPGYLDRTRDQRRACEEKHQPWPGRAAHTRHTNDDVAARRFRLYRDDVDPTPATEQTVSLRAL